MKPLCTPIYLLPGMGADTRMYSEAWNGLPEAHFLDWPAYTGQKTLGEMADHIIAACNIPQNVIVGGSSLGGMVACEIAQKINAKYLILVGSTYQRSDVNAFLRFLAGWSPLTPIKLLQHLAGKSTSNLLSEMFNQADPEFIRAMCLAIRDWEPPELIDMDILRVHGQRDHVISCEKNLCGTVKLLPLENAGHLVGMTHAEQCVDFINSSLGPE